MPLNIDTLESIDALEAIEPEWLALWRCDPNATPFEGPDWLLPWTRRLWGGGQLRVLAVRSGARLVALAPLFLWGYGSRPEIIHVSLLGSGITDHLGMIAAPGFEFEAARLVIEHLLQMSDRWDVCDLEELRRNSPLLRAGLPEALIAQDLPCSACPVLALPRSMEEFTAGLSSKFRANLRQAETRLGREGAEFTLAKPAECEEVIRALFRLHAARWRERREPGVLATEALQQFHLDVVQRLAAHDLLRLFALRLKGEIIAVQYNLSHRHRTYFYLSGFDPAYGRLSPGVALVGWSIRTAIGEGLAEFDFLRKREEFKYQWGARDRINRRLRILRPAACEREVA